MTTPNVIAHFTQCPNCGSTRQLAAECAQETTEKQPGNPAVMAAMVPIVKALSAEVVIAAIDVCMDCGSVYAKDVVRQQAQMRVAPSRQFPGDGHIGGLS